MTEAKWTDEQKNAILEKGDNILVAAAAGSGKTAVLVERIINKILNDDIDIDKLLVVTFTNAAASEMRERILEAIYKRLEEEPSNVKLQRQINLLNKASICTIHSFCLEVIRNYFYELDISANFRVAEDTEIELLKQDVIEDLFEEKYLNKDDAFLTLINTYTTYRDDSKLKELILIIYNYIQSTPFPKKWLEDKVEMFNLKSKINTPFEKTVWGQLLIDEYKNNIIQNLMKLEGIYNKMEKLDELSKFSSIISIDIEKVEEILELLDSKQDNLWDQLYIKANSLTFDPWPKDTKCLLELKTEAKKVRDDVRDSIKDLNKKIMIYNSEEANRDMYLMHDSLVNLKDIIIDFSDKFKTAKKEKNIIDFHDIEHFALDILVKENEDGSYSPSEVALKLKNQYEEIAIDEYQDSNLVQEYILNSVSNGKNIFMVGDVKQSIYRFRQARPELFIEKYEKYGLEDGIKIQLFKNFRSRKNILDLTNLIFDKIMSKKLGDLEYTKEEYLNLGAEYENPDIEGEFAGKTELHIIDLEDNNNPDIWLSETNGQDDENESDELKEDQEPVENILLEAKLVKNRILELLNSNYIVFDKKQGYRKVTYKDIVVLLRATSNVAPIYEKELSEVGIPVFSDSSAEYLESTEIQTIMSVLKVINNPLQDIALITVLRSSIANFTDNELVQIRLADRSESFYNAMLKARVSVDDDLKNKINGFIDLLDKWREYQEIYTLDELIWQIYADSNYYNYVGLLNNGKIRQANLRMLFERARQYEQASFKGLYNFINYIDKLKTSSRDMGAAKIIGENDNVVRIMSIHKSKGLEFPVVFLSGCAKQFNLKDLNEKILLHQDMGFGPKYINYERRIEYSTLAKEAIKLKLKTETIAEEMRILYVALTRAREKLIITGVSKDLQESLKEKEDILTTYNEENINPNLLKKYKSYLDWIELVYLNNSNQAKELIQLYIHSYKELNDKTDDKNDNINLIQKINEEASMLKDDKYKDDLLKLQQELDWEYKYKQSQDIPTKTSVSKIKTQKLSKKLLLKNNIKDNADFQNSLSIPEFEKEIIITPAQKGTLIHLCIQHLDEKKEYSNEDIKELIDSLLFKNIITQNEADAINIDTLLQYTKSDLFKDLKSAKEIHKEEPFYINLKANEIYDFDEDKDVDENILVQGIIDLFYIDQNDKVVLVDYKTDYVQDEKELFEKYEEQLKLYKKAIEKGQNVKVDKVAIYSLYLQKLLKLFE